MTSPDADKSPDTNYDQSPGNSGEEPGFSDDGSAYKHYQKFPPGTPREKRRAPVHSLWPSRYLRIFMGAALVLYGVTLLCTLLLGMVLSNFLPLVNGISDEEIKRYLIPSFFLLAAGIPTFSGGAQLRKNAVGCLLDLFGAAMMACFTLMCMQAKIAGVSAKDAPWLFAFPVLCLVSLLLQIWAERRLGAKLDAGYEDRAASRAVHLTNAAVFAILAACAALVAVLYSAVH